MPRSRALSRRAQAACLTVPLSLALLFFSQRAGAAEERRADRDSDGLADDLDRCPDRAGPRDNIGCPDRDEDGDGIIDRLDRCPSVPGNRATFGCPDGNTSTFIAQPAAPSAPMKAQAALTTGGELVRFLDRRFEFATPVQFEPKTAALTEQGLAALEAVAQILTARPELRRILIEGHVDEPGNSERRARDLSRHRAEVVKQIVVGFGVSPERLRLRGMGYSKLLDRSETAAAQLRNNRIEILALD